jgi:hypothetical protein
VIGLRRALTPVVLGLLLTAAPMVEAAGTPDAERMSLPGSPLGIAAGWLYGYKWAPAYSFMRQLRGLGAGLTKVYLFWNQIEPERGRYDWKAVDAFLRQLRSPEEGLIALYSSSTWATERASTELPASPARNASDYHRFVRDLVAHCRGRVRYWQNDSEPSNPVFWAGTKQQFVEELAVFHRAVKDADPQALVVAGGYDGLFGPPGTHAFPNQQVGLDFFEHVIERSRDSFDLFDIRLYGDPYTIVPRVAYIRERMRAHGYDKPIISTEYGGPGFYEYPENRKYIGIVTAWSQAVATGKIDGGGYPSKGPVAQLYASMDTLPPRTQMFLQGCQPALEARYQRIAARRIVVSNLFALSADVQKTMYFHLIDHRPRGDARFDAMNLMYGKIGLVDIEHGDRRTVAAEAFARMARALAGVQRVHRVDLPEQPGVWLFEVDRGRRGPLRVIWDRRDSFDGEDAPPVNVELDWTDTAPAVARDALGARPAVTARGKRLRIPVSDTPIFIEASPRSQHQDQREGNQPGTALHGNRGTPGPSAFRPPSWGLPGGITGGGSVPLQS